LRENGRFNNQLETENWEWLTGLAGQWQMRGELLEGLGVVADSLVFPISLPNHQNSTSRFQTSEVSNNLGGLCAGE